MNTQKANRIVAGGVFLISFAQFALTVPPSVPFWDCGEFAAAASALQVPHPPGAPLFVLVGRAFQMIPFGDPAWRVNMVSVFADAFTVMLLYLVSVNVIAIWRERIETRTDALLIFGASAIGALSLSFSDTFWSNGVKFDVYAPALLCIAITLWLATQWYHRAEYPYSERYLLLIAYVIGLSMGIHPLGLLGVFTIILIVYFRLRKIAMKGFLTLFSASLLCFIVGFATYAMVLLRSDARPPMNEISSDNVSALSSYLSRNGYDAMQEYPVSHQAKAAYTSDWQFFWKYQTEHVFLRYLYWQYIGRAGDARDAPSGFTMAVVPDAKNDLAQWRYGSSCNDINDTFPIRFFGIPFLIGLFGFYWHFKKDWRTALAFLAGFLAMGIGADLFQNQQPSQARETDYFYTGAFFIYSLWIGIGAFGVLELIADKIQDRIVWRSSAAMGTVAILVVAIDLNMGYNGWKAHDRSGNYLPWDYAYNVLQSCGKNAILFTHGDNDTFPLWYLQDVEGIRRDIRIVNLQLANNRWYVSQLKNERPYGTDAVPMSIPQSALDTPESDSTGLYPKRGEPELVTLPVPRDVMARYTDDPTLLYHPSLRFTYAPDATYNINGKPAQYFSEPEQIVFDIIKTNSEQQWKRPICWSSACLPDEYIGLGDYVRSSGLATTLAPVASRPRNGMDAVDRHAIEQNLLHEPDRGYEKQHFGFRFRGLSDPHLYLDETERRILTAYRQAFLTLATHCVYDEKPDVAEANSVLNTMNANIPHELFPMQYELLYQTAMLFHATGDTAGFDTYSSYAIASCKELAVDPNLKEYIDPHFSPQELMVELYDKRGEYKNALGILNELLAGTQNNISRQEHIQQKIYELEIKDLASQKKYDAAIAITEKALASVIDTTDQSVLVSRQNLERLLEDLHRKAGTP